MSDSHRNNQTDRGRALHDGLLLGKYGLKNGSDSNRSNWFLPKGGVSRSREEGGQSVGKNVPLCVKVGHRIRGIVA